jgi:beta-lactamase class A
MRVQLSRRELLASITALVPAVWMSPGHLGSVGETGKAEEEITAIETRLSGRLGVAAFDVGSGRQIKYRADECFPMCSTFKFLLVAAILTRIDQNKDKLDRVIRYRQADLLEYAPITKAHVQEGGMTIAALCSAAMEYSDNTAANLLLNVLGGPQEVTVYARSLGDPSTRLDRNEPALNTAIPGDERDTTSPAAMLEDMRKIVVGKRALSEASQKQLVEWMMANTTGQQRLRAGLPSSWKVGDKTGTGKNGSTNDIATAWPPNREPILITAYFVGSNASSENRDAALANVGRIVAAQFT